MPTLQAQTRQTESTLMPPASAGISFAHLDHLLTETGLWQHTAGTEPNVRHGYSIDDEARGLIVGLRYWQQGIEPRFNQRLGRTCFRFLESAAIPEGPERGRFHNFCDAQGLWLDSVGSDDSFGRTLWGLGVAHAVDAPFARRADAEPLLRQSLPAIDALQPNYLRAKAFVILGLAACRLDDVRLRELADALVKCYQSCADTNWRWFEDQMTYCNARLPQALFQAAEIFPGTPIYAKIAQHSLDFLLASTRCGQGYAPVGNAPMATDGWFKRGQAHPPCFDQQPVDAGALVECCVDAYRVTGDPRYQTAASAAFEWYLGANIHHVPVLNPATGGVADAVTWQGISRNQGAESVLSVHLAFQALQTIKPEQKTARR